MTEASIVNTRVRPAPSSAIRTSTWRAAVRLNHMLGMTTNGSRALPGFLIVGASRSGTTSLFRYLAAHPAVVAPRFVKGVHYFDLHYAESIDWYRAHFPTMRRLARVSAVQGCQATTGEGSPYYMFHPAIPQRLAQTVPDARVIVILRDPVSRSWSQYQHERAKGFEDLSFEDALAAEDERLAGEAEKLIENSYYVSPSHIHHSYVARGHYLEQLHRLYEALGRVRVLVLEFGELQRDAQGAFNRVTDFLDLPRRRLAQPKAYNARTYEPMRPETRSWLAAQFAESNEELFAELGVRWDWTVP